MLILPAIDLRGGKCVRLRQGDYAQETVFSDDPAAMARRWVDAGAKWLHIVDLDGAKAGRLINGDSVRRIVESCRVPCQLGGGLRTDEDIDRVLTWGVFRVVIGTAAVEVPEWFQAVCERWPARIALGIDAKGGYVATQGWLEVSALSALELANKYVRLPIGAIVYTDISRDGMMQGPNLAAMTAMAAAVKEHVPVIASGGVATLDDIRLLAQGGLAGCIVGRALYEGSIDLKQALEIAG